MPRDFRVYLEDLLAAITKIRRYRTRKFKPLQAVDLPDGCEATMTIGDSTDRSVGQGGLRLLAKGTLNYEEILQCVADCRFTDHARREMENEPFGAIQVDEVLRTLQAGEIIEQYP